MIEVVDYAASDSSSKQNDKMLEAFLLSTRLEYMFWYDAYNRKLMVL